MTSPWQLYPFPTISDGALTDGSLLLAHKDCRRCPTRNCEADDTNEFGAPRLCRYGLTYARIDAKRVLVGVVAKDYPSPTPKSKRRLKLERDRHVSSEGIRRSVDAARALGPGVVSSFDANREAAIAELKSDPAMQRAVADQLRADADQDLGQSHDFMQLVKRIKGYAESLLAQKLPGVAPEEAAEQLHDEGAIFFATQLMVYKMNSLMYINEANRAAGNESTFGIHPLILKYKRIYDWTAEQKGLKIQQDGTYRQATYNGEAIGALVQALLDNMVKYAPSRSTAYIEFDEQPRAVVVKFRSLGPKIENDELEQIFVVKVRARAARRVESTGQGIGLAAAKHISDTLGLSIACMQDPEEHQRYRGHYMTTFQFELASAQ